jgi:hypothetical protein
VSAGLVHRHRDFGDGSALPDDAQVGNTPLAVHGEADLGAHRAEELFAFAHRGGGCIEVRAEDGSLRRMFACASSLTEAEINSPPSNEQDFLKGCIDGMAHEGYT